MKEKIITNRYQIVELLTIFVLTLIINLMCNTLIHDEVWNYGFSYNIATGLIPYKDFNMVITPLFPMLGALFMIIFGKNLVVYHIFNAIICTGIFYYMKKFISKSYYITYAILLLYALPNYNIFCILLLYILMSMEDKKSNDYIVGVVLGLTFLTKQNMGVYLCIPTFFVKDIKKIFKRIIGFIIPNIIILIYLLINDCLYEFINYVFLGIGSFAKKNLIIDPIGLLIIILTLIYLIYKYMKTKDIKTVYLFCFELLVLPLIECYHVVIAIIPTIGYFINTLKLNKKIISYAFIVFIILIFSTSIYSIYTGEYVFPNSTSQYKYRKLYKESEIGIIRMANYLQSIKDELYIIGSEAYICKLEANIPINKYDLLNNGNLGKDGHQKIINEIENNCSKKRCVFLVDTNGVSNDKRIQDNKEIINYIMKSYTTKDNPKNRYLIYTNYK